MRNEAFDSFRYEVQNYLQQNFKVIRILNFQNRSSGSGDVEIGFLANLRHLYLMVRHDGGFAVRTELTAWHFHILA